MPLMSERPSHNQKGKHRVRKTNVPGQALGYSLQFTRLTHLLLTTPEGSFASLEVFEDVGVETPDGQLHFIQSKSALATNPLADRSVALWKTLANWADTLTMKVPPTDKLRLILYVSRPVDGPIAHSFANAKTLADAARAISSAKEELYGKRGKDRENKIAGELEPHLDRFFNAKPEIANAVVYAFEIECGSGSPQSDIEKEISARFVPSERVSLVADHACGWVKRRADKLLEQS